MNFIFEVGLIGGLLAVASNPSPFYAAFGLVSSAGVGCLILMEGGVSFLSLVLFLVYLGGMMVVFAYSAALVAEPHPEAWGSFGVVMYSSIFIFLVGLWWVIGGGEYEVESKLEQVVYGGEWFGVSVLFTWGGGLLMIVGWALLLTLFGVLEVVRGHYSGSLRAV
ncbi:NADH dehydrogenase subunit 6 (mitochondrion) [Phyllobates terribilis]|uniref:NADH-ubiquinone oxidoreductase chain 6 n=1 Tax=Phyllobates terribilis TaxID=111132 RepID=A0A343J6F1_PHYTE|nr:NADH dehydrogenase subunit 6 [Phyllobates terribilis]ASV64522.1 NADH dehydrogenase subunit 6 [Phyllobates terribilis]